MKDDSLNDRMLTIDEVAEIVGYSKRTIEKQLSAGEFLPPTLRKGRIRRWWYPTLRHWLTQQNVYDLERNQIGRPRSGHTTATDNLFDQVQRHSRRK